MTLAVASVFWGLVSCFMFIAGMATAEDESWWPIEVNVYNPSCTSGDRACWRHPANAQDRLEVVEYTPLKRSEVSMKHNICVSFPHLKDSYWNGVAYGIISEGKRLGQKITLVEAGGYTNLERQLSQVDGCIANGGKALIIGAISIIGNSKQIDLLREKSIPVVDVINGIKTQIDAKSLQSFYNMGYLACSWVTERTSDEAEEQQIAWFPGPPGAGWAVEADRGCKDALAGTNVTIEFTKWGDTGKSVQLQLVEDVLASSRGKGAADLEYIVGTATTIAAAVSVIRAAGLQDDIKLVSFYYTPGIHDFLKRGDVAMAPTDHMILQGRIALDQAVRLLEGQEMATGGRPEFGGTGRITEHVQPPPKILTPATVNNFDTSTTLAPSGWRPVFSID